MTSLSGAHVWPLPKQKSESTVKLPLHMNVLSSRLVKPPLEPRQTVDEIHDRLPIVHTGTCPKKEEPEESR